MPFRAPVVPLSPIVALGLATVLSVAACAGASSPAAMPASPATSSPAAVEPGSPTVAPSLAADEIQHPLPERYGSVRFLWSVTVHSSKSSNFHKTHPHHRLRNIVACRIARRVYL
jgi:hypothetical protein